MPAEMAQTRKRYLSIREGKMCERIDETKTLEYNHLTKVHLVNFTYRKVEKDNKVIGETIQLHLVDDSDYWVVETWINSSYAKAFYMMMENLNLNSEISIITDQKVVDGKKKGSLFIKQFGSTIKWRYTKDNPGDLPPMEQKFDSNAQKTVWNDDMQQLFFMQKIENWLLPTLQKKMNPYPNHPVYSSGISGNKIAGEYFGKEQRVGVVGPVSSDERNGFGTNPDPADDLPF